MKKSRLVIYALIATIATEVFILGLIYLSKAAGWILVEDATISSEIAKLASIAIYITAYNGFREKYGELADTYKSTPKKRIR